MAIFDMFIGKLPVTIGDMQPTFGQRLRTIREQKGLNQSELARLAGLAPSYINQLEHGRRKAPTLTTLQALVIALDVPMSLLSGEPGPNSFSFKTPDFEVTIDMLGKLSPEKQGMVMAVVKALSEQQRQDKQ